MADVPYQRKDIRGFPEYQIDTEGTVWSTGKNNMTGIKKWMKCRDHYRVKLYKKVNDLWLYKRPAVHRLVAEAFISNPQNKPFVCHKDDNPLNNNVDNLYWGNASTNLKDAIKNGGFKILKGEELKHAKLKNTDIPLIRELLINSSMRYKRIGELFGVCAHTIGKIARRETWKHI